MTILRPASMLAVLFGARAGLPEPGNPQLPEPVDPQPGSLISRLDTIDRQQAERAATQLGLIPPGPEQDQITVLAPTPQPLPKTQAPAEEIQPALPDPILMAARKAAKAYEIATGANPWTWDGYNAAIIAAVLPIHDAIRDSGIETT